MGARPPVTVRPGAFGLFVPCKPPSAALPGAPVVAVPRPDGLPVVGPACPLGLAVVGPACPLGLAVVGPTCPPGLPVIGPVCPPGLPVLGPECPEAAPPGRPLEDPFAPPLAGLEDAAGLAAEAGLEEEDEDLLPAAAGVEVARPKANNATRARIRLEWERNVWAFIKSPSFAAQQSHQSASRGLSS